MSTPVDNVLAHYGVKGMRWGVRRRSSSGSSNPFSTPKSEDAARAAEALKKPTAALSNDDLQNLVRRLQLEQQFKSLTTTAPKVSRRAKAGAFVTGLLLQVGKEQVTRLARAEGQKRGNVLGKNLGLEDALKEIKKKK
jgi:hypothetical protein